MKTLLLVLGIAALLMGLLWVGQGTGVIAWPASSFMLDQRPWATCGAVLAVVGIVLIFLARRRWTFRFQCRISADTLSQ